MKRFSTFVLVLFLLVSCGAAKKTEAYKTAMTFIQQNTQAVGLLGEISADTSMSSFNIQAIPALAEFTMTVKGAKQSGQYTVKLNKETGAWKPFFAEIVMVDGKKVDLLTAPTTAAEFRVKKDFYAKEKWGKEMTSPAFAVGQTVYYHVTVEGSKQREDGKVLVNADMFVNAPDGQEVLKEPNIISGESELSEGALPLVFYVESNPQVTPGVYNMKIVVRDMIAGKEITSNRKFEFTAQ